MDEKRGIGKNNKIPWHIAEDLVRLKNLTIGRVTIIGRKTYESMDYYYEKSGRQMPGKLYVIVTRKPDYKTNRENTTTVGSLEDALTLANEEETPLRQGFEGQREIIIIGGGQVFKEAMEKDLVDRLYLTIVEGDYNVDTFFPDYSKFTKIILEEDHDNGKYKFKFLTLERPPAPQAGALRAG